MQNVHKSWKAVKAEQGGGRLLDYNFPSNSAEFLNWTPRTIFRSYRAGR